MTARLYQHSTALRPGPKSRPQLGIDRDGRATLTIYLADDSFVIARTPGELRDLAGGWEAAARMAREGADILGAALSGTGDTTTTRESK